MNNFSRIQCAVDFSDASLVAFESGVALAKTQSAELSLVFAVPRSVRFNWRARKRMDLLTEFRDRTPPALVSRRAGRAGRPLPDLCGARISVTSNDGALRQVRPDSLRD